jgi:hypothetical protein
MNNMTERENIIKQYRENIDSKFKELNESINVIMLSDDNMEDSIGFVADDIYELLKVLCSFNTFIKKGEK